MAIQNERLSNREREDQEFLQKIAHLRATPEEVERLFAGAVPFDFDAWIVESDPPTSEELAEMEEFLREREEDRPRGLAHAA